MCLCIYSLVDLLVSRRNVYRQNDMGPKIGGRKLGCHDTQHNDTQHIRLTCDTQHNDTQHNEMQHNDMQHNDTEHIRLTCDTQHKWHKAKATLSITICCNSAQYHDECHVLFIVMLNVIILIVVAPKLELKRISRKSSNRHTRSGPLMLWLVIINAPSSSIFNSEKLIRAFTFCHVQILACTRNTLQL